MDRCANLLLCYFVLLVTIGIVVAEDSNETESLDQTSFNGTESFIVDDPVLTDHDLNCSSSSIPCLAFCCPSGSYVVVGGCSEVEDARVHLPIGIYDLVNDTIVIIENATVDEDNFNFKLWNPCSGLPGWMMFPGEFEDDETMITRNGSLLKPSDGSIVHHGKYCFAAYKDVEGIAILVCPDNPDSNPDETIEGELKPFPIGMILSIVFFVPTFIVYSVLPELKNLHGLNLRAYVGCLSVAYTVLAFIQLVNQRRLSDSICVLMAFTIHFSFLASFFWLNVMCFDIWWTFGGFRSLQGSIKQRERKKFLMYSIYAWGCAAILTAVCVIMDFVPGIPDDILRPEFGVESCWFKTEEAKALYFYGPMGITVVCNIVLFISTAAKIIQHKKDTAHHLKGMDSKRHDDNKQWFNLYLKLFIVMGINWSMEIISWLCQGPKSLWYLTDIANSLQGVIIFIIFVWKQKIKRLLMKRFGCQGTNFLSRDSTRSAYHSSSSRTCTTSIPLHEKTNQFPDPVSRATKNVSDDSDGA